MQLDEKTLNELIEKQLGGTPGNKDEAFNLTREEAEKFKKAFADDGFASLFSDYINEISDPKNRAEQDSYIRQLEERQKLPTGKQVLRPSPGFVIKLRYSKKQLHTENYAHNDSGKGRTTEVPSKSKLFINMVYSDSVKHPTSEDTPRPSGNNTQNGRHWSVPYILGPLRMEEDKGKSLVPTFDCCFHPLALKYAASNVQFKHLIVETAREGVGQQFKSMNNEVIFENSYHILKGVMYKNEKPPVMLMNKESGTTELCEDNNDNSDNISSTYTKHKKTPPELSNFAFKKGFFRKGAAAKGKKRISSLDDKTKPEKCESKQAEIEDKEMLSIGFEVPEYNLIERGRFKIIDHFSNGPANGSLMENHSRPEYLICRIYLPSLHKSSDIELELDEDNLLMQSKHNAQSRYRLSLKLPYPVQFEHGVAKFHKDDKVLELKLPVCRSTPSKSVQNIAPDHKNKEQQVVDTSKMSATSAGKAKVENTLKEEHVAAADVDHSRWVTEGSHKSTSERETFAFDGKLPTWNGTLWKSNSNEGCTDEAQDNFTDGSLRKEKNKLVKNKEHSPSKDDNGTSNTNLKKYPKPKEKGGNNCSYPKTQVLREHTNREKRFRYSTSTKSSENQRTKHEESTYASKKKESEKVCPRNPLSLMEDNLVFGLD